MSAVVPPEGPEVGELYRHRSNQRVCRVTTIRYVTFEGKIIDVLVGFKYRQGVNGSRGLGWKRGVTPTQEMKLDQWRSFFTVRTAKASKQQL